MAQPKHWVSEAATPPTDLRDLRAFCLVVDLGSVTAAAKALGETKGSISRRLARLEQRLGVALVRRSPRLVVPTEDGTAYRLRVGQALELLEDARSALQDARAVPRGRLRVTAPQDLGVRIVAPLIARFTERFPEVKVEMLLTEKTLDFDAHQLDVALRAASSLPDSSLIAHKLLEAGFAFVAAPAYLEKHPAPRTPADLERHRVLLFTGGGGEGPMRLGRAGEEGTSVQLRADVLASDAAFISEVALAGGGIALVPGVLVERELATGRLVQVLQDYRPDSTGTLYLLHPAMQFIPPKIRAFRDFMVEALRKEAT
ncbi:MAG: LysR family transcriptional regulator [Myxococcaceae bacterium]|nr:LysR family transcriptional regulator [Myxococcaceae bacterium]